MLINVKNGLIYLLLLIFVISFRSDSPYIIHVLAYYKRTAMSIDEIYTLYYSSNPRLEHLLREHSSRVAAKALECVRNRRLKIDETFLYEAAMLHDIGIFLTDAPGIYCHGAEPYIRHGVLGRELLDTLGMPRHALVCERHTGAGITVDDIISQQLPLPLHDMTPQSPEEKLICYADKFYSKSGDPSEEKTLERVCASMAKHGPETLARFEALHSLFGLR